MATTTRSTPLGAFLDDGFSTKIAFADDPDVSFWEKSVQPAGLDGGDAIEVSNMFNTTYRTFAPRSLVTLTTVSVVAAWDPWVWSQILALINTNGNITITFPNTDTLDFFGFLQTFEPQDQGEGEQPEANITITPTNRDVNGDEIAAVFTTSQGTGT